MNTTFDPRETLELLITMEDLLHDLMEQTRSMCQATENTPF